MGRPEASGALQRDKQQRRTAQPKATRKPPSNYAQILSSYKPARSLGKSASDYVTVASLVPQASAPTLAPASSPEVYEFLRSCELERYHSLLLEQGIEDLATLFDLTEEHLTELKVPLGHRLKLLKKIREALPKPPSPAATATQQPSPQHPRRVHFEAARQDDGTDPTEAIPVKPAKLACWTCYRIFNAAQAEVFDEKDFCSAACLAVHSREATVECTCGASVVKGKGEVSQGKWYCSATCVPAD